MNKFYRVIWNISLGTWVAVAETARARGKRNGTVKLAAAAVLSLTTVPALAGPPGTPSVTVATGYNNANAYAASNGATVVNISTPNSAGLSSNYFQQYNVNSSGLVLNNNNTSTISAQSQLAGKLYSNTNLTTPASVILNQVVSNNRSNIAGFTEVAGTKADVIVANPYGITCSGCGFLNTDRVTLTTGVPVLNSAGALAGFNVQQGDILVNGSGLNASGQQILDLVTRAVELQAPINVPDLGITTGTNQWSYITRSVTGSTSGVGAAPSYAIDSSALGGMYANRIRLIATENGVGVRLLGNAAAATGDFVLTSAGTIALQNQISAKQNITITGTDTSAQSVTETDSSLTAGQDLSLTSSGGVTLNGGALVASQNLGLTANSLIDSADSATLSNNNQRAAGSALTLNISNAANLNGTDWQAAAGDLQGTVGSLNVGTNGATLKSSNNLSLNSSGDLQLGTANLSSGKDLNLTVGGTLGSNGGQLLSTNNLNINSIGDLNLGTSLVSGGVNTNLTAKGAINIGNAAGEAVEALTGTVSVTAGNGLNNAGTISANAGSATLDVSGTLSNSGKIQSLGNLTIADATGANSETIVNSGSILTTGQLNLQGASVGNTSTGTVQANQGSTLKAGSLTNAGQWLLSTQTGAADTMTVSGALTNSGTLQSAHDLNLTAQSVDNQSHLLTAGNLTATVASTFNNEANATTQSGSTLTLSGANTSLTNSGTLQATAVNLTTAAGITNSGTMSGGSSSNAGTLTIHSGATLNNTGVVQSNGALNIDMNGTGADQVTNSGTIFTTDALTLTGASVGNTSTGTVQADKGSTLQASSLTNAGQWLLSTQTGTADTVTVSGALTNSGTLQSARDLNLTTQSLDNQSNLLAVGNLTATVASTFNNETNAITQSGSTLTLSGANTSLTNSGTLQAIAVNLTTAAGITNSGTMSGGSNSVVGTLAINSGNTVSNTGVIQSSSTLNVNMNGAGADQITNNGKFFAGTTLTLTGNTINNTNAGTTASLTSQGTIQLNLAGSTPTLTNNGLVQSSGILTVNDTSGSFTNQSTGVLHGNGLNLNFLNLTNAGVIQGDTPTSSTVNVSGTLDNQSGATLTLGSSGTGSGVITTDILTNEGLLQSYAGLNLNIGHTLQDTGTIAATTDLNINSNGGSYNLTVNCTSNCSTTGGALSGGNNVTISNAASIDVGARNTISGGNITLGSSSAHVGTLTLESNSTAGGRVAAANNLNIYANTVNMNGSNTRFLADTSLTSGDTFNFNVYGLFTNKGLVFSGDALNLTASGITNAASGGVLALGNLTLDAGSAALTNNAGGQLYAGNNLTIQNVSTLTNYGNSSTAAGSIYAPNGSISITANDIENQSQIEAGHNITLTALTINNTLPSTVSITTGAAVNGTETSSVGNSSTPPSTCGLVSPPSGCSNDGTDSYWNNYHSQPYSQTQSYTNGKPSFLPQIISSGAGTITLQNFVNASNYGGVISGGSVNLNGLSGISTFTNNSLNIYQLNYTHTWEWYVHYIALGPATYTNNSDYNDQTVTNTPTLLDSIGGTIYASSTGTINANVTHLINNGSTAASIASTASPVSAPSISAGQAQSGTAASTASGATSLSGTSLIGTNSATAHGGTNLTHVTQITPLSPQGFSSLTGITITLPTNPNGYFVINQSPTATYLIETNPLLGSNSSYLGASYLEAQLGINPDTQMQLVGDNNYQAYLTQQELIAKTGNQLLSGYGNLAQQMAGLTGNAVAESKSLGLVYGQAPTDAQLSKLTNDIVWMVATVVDGHQVLAPVVYLSAATKAGIVQGAIIQGGDVNLNVTTLTNTGGTINGTNSLNVQAQGNITNTSGMIEGGNVNLNSTNGSIINQTMTQGNGNDQNYATIVGKQAGIKSTGDMTLTAGKDITNLGANVNAGGNASLKAGGNVTFDTVQNTTTDTTHTASKSGYITSNGTTTTTTTQQIGSGLMTGGNLNIQSGKDITIAGSNVTTGGDASLNAGNNINIISRENTTNTTTDNKSSGLGMNNSLYGSSETKTTEDKGVSVGSNFNVGGNANLTSKNDLNVQGSNVNVTGNGTVNAKNVNVTAAQNYDNTTSTTTTTSVLGVSSNAPGVGNRPISNGSATADSGTTSQGGDGLYQGSASASTSAQGQAKAGLDFGSKTTTETNTTNIHNVGSNVNFGGNATINASNDVNLVGSKVNAGGDATVNAKNVNVSAAQDVSTSSTTSTTDSVGLLGNTVNQAGAGANASGSASGGIGRAPNVNGGADANASASTENELNFVDHTQTTSSTLDITHQASSITSGGNLNINAKQDLNVAGSNLNAGKNANVNATNMNFTAVNDVHQSSNSSNETTFGTYASGNASADANANAAAGIGANSSASASASATAGVGMHGTNNQTGHTEGSTTAQVSSITAGGDINRNATNSINDVGTNITAGGDLNQSAKTITSQAAQNTTYSTDTTSNTDARVGLYAGVGSSVSGTAGVGGASTDVTPISASAGINASVEHDQSSSSNTSSNAVVSNIKVGGSVNSKSSGTTTLQGTNVSAGNDVNLGAGTLNITAAQDTTSSSSVQGSGTIGGQLDLLNKQVTVSGSGAGGDSSSNSSNAVVANIQAGHNLTLSSKGDTTLQGTNLSSGGATTVNTGGNLNYSAAQNTSSSTTHSADANVSVTVGKKSVSGQGGVDYSQEKTNSSQDVVGSINSGGPITVNTGGNSTFTGTNLSSNGDVNVNTGGNLSFNAAHDTQSSTGGGFGLSGSAGKKSETTSKTTGNSTTTTTTNEKSGGLSADINYNNSSSDTATGGSITSGGNIQLHSGKNTSFQGTQVSATDQVNVAAGGTVSQTAAVSTSSDTGFDLSAGGGGSSKTGTSTTKQGISRFGGNTTPEKEHYGGGVLDFTDKHDSSSQNTSISGGQGVTITPNSQQTIPPVPSSSP
ncbi:MAG: hemagglutinin repeat-containing protein [Gammaproteobacteria bacterium]|nr:hemagglutinin repeat-containing protein [Gammaproteobacteria bacterium]